MKFSRNKVALKWEWCHNKAIYQGQLLNMWSVKIKLIIGFMRWVTTVTVTGQSQQCKFWIDFPVHRNFWQFLYIKHCRFLHVPLVLFCFVLHEFSPELSYREQSFLHHPMLLFSLFFLGQSDSVCFLPLITPHILPT